MRRIFWMTIVVAALYGCARVPPAAGETSVVPGTIGVAVQRSAEGVVVSAVGTGSPAARAGLKVGDRVVRYNGEDVNDVREFERLVLESEPGSVARVEVVRGGAARTLDVRVEQVRTANRV